MTADHWCDTCLHCKAHTPSRAMCTLVEACEQLEGQHYAPTLAAMNGGWWMDRLTTSRCTHYLPGIEVGPRGGDDGGACDREDQH